MPRYAHNLQRNVFVFDITNTIFQKEWGDFCEALVQQSEGLMEPLEPALQDVTWHKANYYLRGTNKRGFKLLTYTTYGVH